MHLPVVGGDDERGVRREHVEQAADELVGDRQLGSVERVVQAELVRDAVDARVVGVHEPLPRPTRRRQCSTSAETVLQPTNRCPADGPR